MEDALYFSCGYGECGGCRGTQQGVFDSPKKIFWSAVLLGVLIALLAGASLRSQSVGLRRGGGKH